MVLCPSGKDPPAKSGELAQEESPPNEQLPPQQWQTHPISPPAAPAALCEGTGTEKGEWTARMGMSAAGCTGHLSSGPGPSAKVL